MKKFISFTLSLALLILVFSANVYAAVPNGFLSGKVYDSDGMVVEGAQVKIIGYGGPLTSKYGNYSFDSLPVSTYTVTCKYDGNVINQTVTIIEGQNTLNFGTQSDFDAPVTNAVVQYTEYGGVITLLNITLNVTDASKIKSLYWRLNDGQFGWSKVDMVNTHSFTLGADNRTKLEYYAVDYNGYVEPIKYFDFVNGTSNGDVEEVPSIIEAEPPTKTIWQYIRVGPGAFQRVYK